MGLCSMASAALFWGPVAAAAIVGFVVLKGVLQHGSKFFTTEHLVTNYRTAFVVVFLLPMSVVFDGFWYLRNKWLFASRNRPEKHNAKVAQIQERVKNWRKETGGKVKMCTGRAGWLTMSLRVGTYKKTHYKVNLDLKSILEVNEKEKFVRVEPLVTMGQITATLLPLGWTIPVLPELDDLTVGGLISGFGVETSSHKYGLFQYTCRAFEVVTSSGELVRCSATENADLFYTIPWSHGTIGFLVAAEIMLVPAKEYVKVSYRPYRNRKNFLKQFDQEARSGDDQGHISEFVEALAFSKDDFVLMCADYADRPTGAEAAKINAIGTWYKPWFFEHVRSHLSRAEGSPVVEYIPLRDYYHRHSRSLFWEMEDIIPFGNHPVFRMLLGWMVPPKVALLKLTQTDGLQELYTKHHVDQDMLVPMVALDQCIQTFHKNWESYPLWLCPMAVRNLPDGHRGLINGLPDGDEMFVDVGAYGQPRVKNFDAKRDVRAVEKFVREAGGFQALYADTYMTRDEFRDMFDHSQYDQMRKKYEAEDAFPTIYDKVNASARR